MGVKDKSIMKLSNFKLQWTKTLCENHFKHIAFFFTLFKGHKCNNLYEITPIGARENFKPQKPQTSQNEILCTMILPVFSQFL